MKRRTFLKSLAAAAGASAVGMPALAETARNRTLIYVPRTGLASLDPIWSTAATTSTYGYCVFDALYGIDSEYRTRPQMAEGHTVSDDGRTWLIRLRPGLKFHDGEPVLARDCIASLQRWSVRDNFGTTLAAAIDAWETADDRTLRLRLKKPFPSLPDAMAHPFSSPCLMMPERVAKTDPSKQITEPIGSGPFRFVKGEYVAGTSAVFERFDGYVPREEPPSGTAGGKKVYFDRMEWQAIPDDATAAAALQAGEVDWWEIAYPDLVPKLSRDKRLKVEISEPYGILALLKFNCLVPPFDNAKLRHIVLTAVDQGTYMPAVAGEGPDAWRTCYAAFHCGLPNVKEVGTASMSGQKDLARLRAAVRDAGYKGEKVVILNPADYGITAPLGRITADLLTKIGFNVDLQEMDFGTAMQRRQSRDPTERGGWSIFHSPAPAGSVYNPALNIYIRGQGIKGWFGWFNSPEMEQLITEWLENTADAERPRLMDAIQQVAFEQAPVVPLGLFYQRTAFRSDLSGFLPGSVTVPWNMRRS